MPFLILTNPKDSKETPEEIKRINDKEEDE
jgi:hypothetical protein